MAQWMHSLAAHWPQWIHSFAHWLQWGTVPAWFAAAISLWQARQARKSARKSKEAEEDAKEQAKRATEAAEKAATAQADTAGHVKTLAEIAQQRTDAAETTQARLIVVEHVASLTTHLAV